jgi:hypothetical protein
VLLGALLLRPQDQNCTSMLSPPGRPTWAKAGVTSIVYSPMLLKLRAFFA